MPRRNNINRQDTPPPTDFTWDDFVNAVAPSSQTAIANRLAEYQSANNNPAPVPFTSTQGQNWYDPQQNIVSPDNFQEIYSRGPRSRGSNRPFWMGKPTIDVNSYAPEPGAAAPGSAIRGTAAGVDPRGPSGAYATGVPQVPAMAPAVAARQAQAAMPPQRSLWDRFRNADNPARYIGPDGDGSDFQRNR